MMGPGATTRPVVHSKGLGTAGPTQRFEESKHGAASMAEPGASGLISCFKGSRTVEPTHKNIGKPTDSGLVASPKEPRTASPTLRPTTEASASGPAGQL